MNLDQDFSEFVEFCIAREVQFLIVGGYAVAAHGHPRFTKDLDVWVLIDQQNAERLIDALSDFGFASLGLTAADFLIENAVIQLGQPPKRIDLLTSIDGVDFASCWSRRLYISVGNLSVPFISVDDLITNKRASGRPQDAADVARLANEAD